ncbi:MAG TPA: class I SAM-dependent methyltransferase [Candidatus Binatia bacterium]|nr:class I SAM-dependent methyltransferase [Candidatus Binatia bacterium]
MATDREHLQRVRDQFARQADAYSSMAVVRSEKLLASIADAADVGPGDRVLDLASGPGYLTMLLATRAREVVGVDATERFVEQARAEAARRGISNVSFRMGDVEQLDVPDASFDAVTCKFAFHHFPRPANVLAEMARVARPGGTIVIADMVASEDPAKRAYQDEIERLCDPSHASALMASELERMFRERGLEVVACHRRETSYRLGDWMAHGGPSARDARRIVERMEASLDVDRSGLRVRREDDGEIAFSHQGATYVLRVPG